MRRIPGVVVAIVKSLDDPAGEGRIALEFPWLPDAHRSAFAPVAAPLAGKERGFFFMPEPEDEVLVAFEHGDFDHPFILGYLWNGVDKPPRDQPSTRVLVSPGGHSFEFEDEAGSRKITLTSAASHTIAIDDAAQTITVKTAGSQQIVLSDADLSIELNGGGRSLAMRGGQVLIT